ncbi:hypothetical protein GGF46_002685 [Coemansia sp. RSA 552]|nr:hypothetical protein GGF46_002685 [Coemansia sp. RSA 552]
MLSLGALSATRTALVQRHRGGGSLRASFARLLSTALLDRRLELWDREQQRRRQQAGEGTADSAGPEARVPVTVLGKEREMVAGVTRPLDLARKYDQKNAKRYIAALVNGTTTWDLQRPLPRGTQSLAFLRFDEDNNAAREVFWHSSAHVMGAALEQIYGDDLLLCDGPALSDGSGFFYEFLLLSSEGRLKEADRLDQTTPFSERIDRPCGPGVLLDKGLRFLASADMDRVQRTALEIASSKQPFQRMEVGYDFACELFRDNPFKLHFLDRARKANVGPDAGAISLYRCGKMIDLCRGPHVVHTAQLQAFMINRVSSAHWAGHLDSSSARQQKMPVLNRIYGISFPNAELLKQHQARLEAVAQRDHRAVGREQKLFMMHPWAPGSGFILPHGLRMVNTILSTIRQKYAKYGFDEVSTPLMYNRLLWETSGHWENYRDDMFTIATSDSRTSASAAGCCEHDSSHAEGSPDATLVSATGGAEFGLKPMNCPGHCLIFASDLRSYRDLPIRYADFSPLHRNEIAGALSGLTRVRKFHQDDGHIFCARDQVSGEIENCLRLIGEMYEMFGFASYELALSTRPDKFIGEISEWDQAESALADALEKSGHRWTHNPGDGAFYGPKIDVRVQDALGRKHQTATIQLDFQLPQRFELKYTGPDGKQHRPVMIHRAVLGSMERMLAILIEHWGGKWPFWINPRQAIVIPTTTADGARGIAEYAQSVRDMLANDKHPESVDSHRFFVDADLSGNTLKRAVREAQLAQYSYMLVVGEKELANGTVDVRQRGGARIGQKTIAEVKAMFQELVETRQ